MISRRLHHRISALEAELERLWDLRRKEQAAPLRETALTEEEENVGVSEWKSFTRVRICKRFRSIRRARW